MTNAPSPAAQQYTNVDYHALAERLVGRQLPKRRPLTEPQISVFAEIIAILEEDRAARHAPEIETHARQIEQQGC